MRRYSTTFIVAIMITALVPTRAAFGAETVIKSLSVKKVSWNSKTNLTDLEVDVAIARFKSGNWLFIDADSRKATSQGKLGQCYNPLGCTKTVKFSMKEGSTRGAFVAIPDSKGAKSMSLAIYDPYQWPIVKDAINLGGWSVAANIFLCESQYGDMAYWRATARDRKEFNSGYKVKKWSTVLALVVNDGGLILSAVPTNWASGAARDASIEIIAGLVLDEVLDMPRVEPADAITFGNVMMGYALGKYLEACGSKGS